MKTTTTAHEAAPVPASAIDALLAEMGPELASIPVRAGDPLALYAEMIRDFNIDDEGRAITNPAECRARKAMLDELEAEIADMLDAEDA